jgi:hypothetical protein
MRQNNAEIYLPGDPLHRTPLHRSRAWAVPCIGDRHGLFCPTRPTALRLSQVAVAVAVPFL